jgi:hypothetical protein
MSAGPAPQAPGGRAPQAPGGPAPQAAGAMVSPWRGAVPELLIAGGLVLALAVAGYVMASWAGLAVVAVATAAAAIAVLRILLPAATADRARTAREKAHPRTLSGYSHRRFVVQSSCDSLSFYQAELRPVLEHLLAARLAERHGVNLYADREAARRLLCRTARDADLWAWVDPAWRPPGRGPGAGAGRGASTEKGIPGRTLTRLIDRLERL